MANPLHHKQGLDDPAASLWDQCYTPMLVVDQRDCIHACNAAWENLLGGEFPRLAGLPLSRLEYLAPTLLPLIQRSRESQRRHIARNLLLHFPRGPHHADVVTTAVDHGVLIELPAFDPLRGPRDSLERWQQAEALELMVQGLCHEIRNPLSGMRGAAQLLEQELLALSQGQALAEYTRLIQSAADRVTALIQQFSRQAQQAQVDAVNIHQLIDEAIALQQASWGGTPRLLRDYDPSIPEIQVEAALISQVILNLLNNAAQAQASEVTVRTRIEHACPLPEGSRRSVLAISVEDDGHGVPRHLRDILFLPMVSGRPDGTGFGLALAQQTARRHGGLLQYLERPQGSVFRLLLPLTTLIEANPRGAI